MIQHIAIVSLSAGTLGEDFVRHELELGLSRLAAYGVQVTFMPHALKGIDYVQQHPEARAADLLQAFADPTIDMILCAIGGDDTYRLLPYLMEHDALATVLSDKIFLGFSDTTINHLMLHKLGLKTFYGQSFLSDICELASTMLPYTQGYFEELIQTGTIRQIVPSDVWYECRASYGVDQLGVPLTAHVNQGFRRLQGSAQFSGPILGGCLDSLYELFVDVLHADMPTLCQQYRLFPSLEDWAGRILLLETSEEKMPPERFRQALMTLKATGLFDVIAGVLVGKPMDEAYATDYEQILVEVIANPDLPVVCNLNIGHAQPRAIIPFGVPATVDVTRQVIQFGD